jgi:hypothetical protein
LTYYKVFFKKNNHERIGGKNSNCIALQLVVVQLRWEGVPTMS